jgi:hypothetical protein
MNLQQQARRGSAGSAVKTTVSGALKMAERSLARLEKAAIAARNDLGRVSSARDGRALALLNPQHVDRIRFNEATNRARECERKLDEARANVERLRAKNRPRVDHRAVLRGAVAAAARAGRAIPRGKAAAERSRALLSEAEERLTAAQAALQKARETDAKNVAKAAAGARSPCLSAMVKARRQVQAAEDALEAARSAREILQAKDPEIAQADVKAKDAVTEAIDELLKSELPFGELIAQCETATEQLTRRRLILRNILRDRLVTDEQREAITSLLHAQLPDATGDPDRWNRHAVSSAWRELRAKLATDPDAKLQVLED